LLIITAHHDRTTARQSTEGPAVPSFCRGGL
jgi:hypothetical protein